MFKSGFEKVAFNWGAATRTAGKAFMGRSNLMAGAAGAVGGGIHGGLQKDEQGNRGGLSGALKGAAGGGAGAMLGHAAYKGIRGGMRGAPIARLGSAPKMLSAPTKPPVVPAPMRDVTPRSNK
jgi:hypothetical protein